VPKRIGNVLWVHRSAVPGLNEDDRSLVQDAAGWLEPSFRRAWSVVRIRAKDVMFGITTPFETDPHPALLQSVLVTLRPFGKRNVSEVREHGANPPVYHRKEQFVDVHHPLYETFARLTRQEEAAGLLGRPDIGRKRSWERVLADAGCALRGHDLVRRPRSGQANRAMGSGAKRRPRDEPTLFDLESELGMAEPQAGFDLEAELGISVAHALTQEVARPPSGERMGSTRLPGSGPNPLDAWEALWTRWTRTQTPFRDLDAAERKERWQRISDEARTQSWAWEPNLRYYDAILVNTSSGKDSMAITDRVLELADKQGVRDRVLLVHCDLGESEWPGVKELAQQHARVRKVPIRIVKRDVAGRQGETVLDRVVRRGLWPEFGTRYCTSEFKTAQVDRLMTALIREHTGIEHGDLTKAGFRPVRFLNVLGLRAEESPGREDKTPFEVTQSDSRRVVHRWLPIHGWTAEEVWSAIRERGLRWHWVYDKGLERLSCVFCPLAGACDLVRAVQLAPEMADRYLAAEREMIDPVKNPQKGDVLEAHGRTLTVQKRTEDTVTVLENGRESVMPLSTWRETTKGAKVHKIGRSRFFKGKLSMQEIIRRARGS